ncbi:hypothetical protein HDU81_002907 [Chytriomyces hyalinus]|nr:hypothetical protein HDU81_002907 [Chytriomyces hyalinus]
MVLAQQADRICRSSVCMDVQVDGSTAIITVQCSSRGWCAVGLGVSRMGDTNPATSNPIIVGWMNAGKPVVSLRNLPSDAMPVFGAAAAVVDAPPSAQPLDGAAIAFSVAVDAGLVADVNQNFIFAASDQPPANPGNAQSSFGVHSERGSFAQKLKLTDVAGAQVAAQAVQQPSAAAQALAPAPSAAPSPAPPAPQPASPAPPAVSAAASTDASRVPPPASTTRQDQLSPAISTRQSAQIQANSVASRSEQALIPPATIDPNDPGLLMDDPSNSATGIRQSSTTTRVLQTRTSTRATNSVSGETAAVTAGSSTSSDGASSTTSSSSSKSSTMTSASSSSRVSSRATNDPSNIAGSAFRAPSGEVDTGLILAGVLGGLAGLGVIGGLIFFCVAQAKKRRPKHEPLAQYESGLRAANEGEFLASHG